MTVTQPNQRSPRWQDVLSLDRLAVVEAFVVIAALALFMQAQADTWWHLAAGRDMVKAQHIALTDTWSHTVAGGRWPNYEWLSELLMFAVYRAGGLPGVTICGALLVLAAQLCSWRLGRGPIRWRAVLMLATLSCVTIVWSPRPQLFTYCLVPLFVALLHQRQYAWSALAAVVWTNLHGGAAYAVLLAGTAAIVAAVLDRSRLRPLVLTTMAAMIAGLLTPLGVGYWPAIVQSIARSRTNAIIEWQPPALTVALAPFWLTAAALVILAARHRRQLTTFNEAFPVAAAAVVLPLALGSLRNVAVFELLAVPAITRLIWRDDVPERARTLEPWRARLHVAILVASIGALGTGVGFRWIAAPERMGWTPMSTAAAAAIGSCRAPIYNGYNEGGILVWFVPGQPVFIDSRQDPYPVQLVQAHGQAERTGDYEPLFDQYAIQCAVFHNGSEGPARLAARGWHERFRDNQWVVLERD